MHLSQMTIRLQVKRIHEQLGGHEMNKVFSKRTSCATMYR